MLLPSEYNAWPPRIVHKISEVSTKFGPATTELLERKPQAIYLIFLNIIRLSKSVLNPNQYSYLSRTAEEDYKEHRQCYSQNIDHPEPRTLFSCLQHLPHYTWLKNKT